MKGFFENKNPSLYVDRYINGKKKKDNQATTENLKKALFKCAVSDLDTDVYGSMMVIAELKLKRAYSSTFLDNLIKEYVKVIHDYAMENSDNYNRYVDFITDYDVKLSVEMAKLKNKGKSEPELMQDNYYYRLVESLYVLKILKEDLREVYNYHLKKNQEKKKNKNNERVD